MIFIFMIYRVGDFLEINNSYSHLERILALKKLRDLSIKYNGINVCIKGYRNYPTKNLKIRYTMKKWKIEDLDIKRRKLDISYVEKAIKDKCLYLCPPQKKKSNHMLDKQDNWTEQYAKKTEI